MTCWSLACMQRRHDHRHRREVASTNVVLIPVHLDMRFSENLQYLYALEEAVLDCVAGE